MRPSKSLTTLARWSSAVSALAGLTLLSGCKFWLDGHQSTIEVAGPVAADQRHIFYVTCWVTLVIFVIVGAVLAYATWKFRARNAEEENILPANQESHGNPLIEVGLIAASTLALVIIAFPTVRGIWYTYEVPAAERDNAYEVTATGFQWWFKFEYPNEQIENVGHLITANELVIPAGRPVHINLRTTDVIHSFWVPKLAGKVDMIPNRGNSLWLQADQPGYFWGQCAEYCGDSHAVMRFRVIALEQREFDEWVEQQKKPARVVAADTAQAGEARAQFASLKEWRRNAPGYTDKYDVAPLDAWRQHQHPDANEDPALIAQGRKLFQEKTCVACHTVRGHEGVGIGYPDLTHVASRTTIAGGLLENNPEQLARWLHHPDEVKPGNKMYVAGYVPNEIKLSDADVHALVAYLESLK